jgi:hypothetical protein
LSRSHSQSSFTSLERLEIRRLIKTFKTKGLESLKTPSPILPSSSEQFLSKQLPSISIIKPKKSSITEELDREFNKIRSINPHEDLIYVKPSLMHKQKNSFPPLPTFDELVHQIANVNHFLFPMIISN